MQAGLLEYQARPARSFYARTGKRVFDVACALSLLFVTAPLLLAILVSLLISGGAPIYAHGRVGKDRQAFRCYKFRTMCKDSGTVLSDVLDADPAAAREWAATCKLTNDPRITRLGNFLRRTSLDELPQLFNVLRGDMSMVGPRPVTDEELPRYGNCLGLYLSVRPGLTGPWQVHGRGVTTYPERVQMDARYVRDIGFASDLRLILQTGAVVFEGSGA